MFAPVRNKLELENKLKREREERKNEEREIFSGGFNSQFWKIMDKEWRLRLAVAESALKQNSPLTVEGQAAIVKAQAEIACIEGMFALAAHYQKRDPETEISGLKK